MDGEAGRFNTSAVYSRGDLRDRWREPSEQCTFPTEATSPVHLSGQRKGAVITGHVGGSEDQSSAGQPRVLCNLSSSEIRFWQWKVRSRSKG
jgi:hypothetical protein